MDGHAGLDGQNLSHAIVALTTGVYLELHFHRRVYESDLQDSRAQNRLAEWKGGMHC